MPKKERREKYLMSKAIIISDAQNVDRLNHLGIVAGICDEIGLVEEIDRLIPSAGQRKVNIGVAVKAMTLNGLGFVQQTLYMTPQFFSDKTVGHLLGSAYEAQDFHDDCLGDALGAVYAYGVNKLFFHLSYHAHQHYDLEVKKRPH